MSYPRFESSGHSRAAVRFAWALGQISRLWGQRGLGTLFKAVQRQPVVGSAHCVVELSPGSFFETDVFDPFWGPTVVGGRPYEPELMYLFRRIGELHPVIIDAGANYGYWSVIATSPEIGFRGGVAIEANPATARLLRANAQHNGNRFSCLERAVGAMSGEHVSMNVEGGHATAHVSTKASGTAVQVDTITIDDAVREAGLWSKERFVLKLDVEGYELPAIEGASELRREKEHLICFEDFADSGPSGFEHVRALFEADYCIYYVTQHGRCERIASGADTFRVMARHPKLGNSRNFVAVRPTGPFFDALDRWVA